MKLPFSCLLSILNEVFSYGKLATIVGRYYAMDRDKRWERINVAYESMIGGVGEASEEDKVVDLVKVAFILSAYSSGPLRS